MLLRSYLQTHHGLARRAITQLINERQILINNQAIESYNTQIKKDDILQISRLNIKEKITDFEAKEIPPLLAFNKPCGYTCSKADPHNPTFYELLPKTFQKHYYYIGRLDKNSHGLMLLTTHPERVHLIEHPSKGIPKSYLVGLDHPFNRKMKEKILGGIKDSGEILKAINIAKAGSKIKITLNEGKKRHIRRIFKSLGYEVLDLQRIAIGNYELGKLPEKSYQAISLNQILDE